MNNINTASRGEGWIEVSPLGQGVTPNMQLHAARESMGNDYGFDVPAEPVAEMRSTPAKASAPTVRAASPATAPAALRVERDPAPAATPNTVTSPRHGRHVWGQVAARLTGKVEAFRKASAEHRAFVNALHERGLSPGQSAMLIERAEKEVLPTAGPDELIAHSNNIAALKAVTPAAISAAARLVHDRLDVLRKQAEDIATDAGKILDELHADAIAKESAFLSVHGLPHQPTALSHRVESAKTELAAMLETLEHSRQLIPLEGRIWSFDFSGVLAPLLA